MTHLVSLDAGLWVWLAGSIALCAILAARVVVLWTRDRRLPRMTLGWLGSWVLLHIVPLIGILGLLAMLEESMRAFVARHTSPADNSAI